MSPSHWETVPRSGETALPAGLPLDMPLHVPMHTPLQSSLLMSSSLSSRASVLLQNDAASPSALPGDAVSITAPAPTPDLTSLKDCWANVAAPVAAVTLRDDEQAVHGTTITAFSSISFDPPIVMVSLSHAASFLKRLDIGTSFVLNVLQSEQAGIAATCASRAPDKFQDIALTESPWGPQIVDAAAHLGCTVNNIVEAGDHQLVFANIEYARSDAPRAGLLYWQRQFVVSTEVMS